MYHLFTPLRLWKLLANYALFFLLISLAVLLVSLPFLMRYPGAPGIAIARAIFFIFSIALWGGWLTMTFRYLQSKLKRKPHE